MAGHVGQVYSILNDSRVRRTINIQDRTGEAIRNDILLLYCRLSGQSKWIEKLAIYGNDRKIEASTYVLYRGHVVVCWINAKTDAQNCRAGSPAAINCFWYANIVQHMGICEHYSSMRNRKGGSGSDWILDGDIASISVEGVLLHPK